jgi:hypothetical protein
MTTTQTFTDAIFLADEMSAWKTCARKRSHAVSWNGHGRTLVRGRSS